MDIAAWLRGLSLERCAEAFRDNAIELEVLPEQSETDLEKIGVLLGHRKIMLKAIAALGPQAPQHAAVSVHAAADGSPLPTFPRRRGRQGGGGSRAVDGCYAT
jgi:hypothetical protein